MQQQQSHILIVGPGDSSLSALAESLSQQEDTIVRLFEHPRALAAALPNEAPTVVVLDHSLPSTGGVLADLCATHPAVPVIIVRGDPDTRVVVRCIRAGAFDYLAGPLDLPPATERIMEAVRQLVGPPDSEARTWRDGLRHPEVFAPIITQSPAMKALFLYAESVAPTSSAVLLTGDTGTGKELLAEALHALSGRRGDLVAVNVSAFDDAMFADALFGHVRGAYTGAERERPGLIERAAGGTLFLDEIGDLSSASQLKLLRLTETGEYLPVGADLPKKSDARIIVATNRHLGEQVNHGHFRKDLYYRLRTHHLHLPPLSERKGDLPLLLEHFLGEAAAEMGKGRITYPPELLTLLRAHYFPGNIRELRALVYDAVSKHPGGVLSTSTFRATISPASPLPPDPDRPPVRFGESLPTIKQTIELLVDEALTRAEGNQSLAARLLGISQPALNKRLKKRKAVGEHP